MILMENLTCTAEYPLQHGAISPQQVQWALGEKHFINTLKAIIVTAIKLKSILFLERK